MGRRHLSKGDSKAIAKDRIDRLFQLAQAEAVAGKMDRSKRYVGLALRMGERHKVRSGHKRTYCPSCHSYFIPSRNMRARVGKGRVSITCLACGHVTRYPLGKNG